jgi:hypothetical protein
MMNAAGSSETLTICQTTRRHVSEEINLEIYRRENHKPHVSLIGMYCVVCVDPLRKQ